jgi:ATP-dependent DNA helicase Q1
MEDQIYGLKKRNINAEMISQSTDKTTVNAIHKLLADSSFSCPLKLLYVTPERLANSKRLMSNLQKCHQFKKLDLIAIDEVHCCSTWGHDFRPDYKFLGSMKMLFPQVPILGVTATASTRVLTDVQKILNIRECLTFNAPFNRPNLFYHVLEKPGDKEGVFELLAKLLKERFAGKSGIIYTFSIKDTEEITSELLQRDVKVRPYHANLESSVRSNVHTKWITGEIQAVVATVAFGMGIDKPDVRFVIHHTLSKSMENFYQESGRAGRDGEYAECILLYRFGDIFKTTTMTFTEHNGLKNAYSMIDYCINGKKCRRDLIARYFREVWSDNSCRKMCDHCYYKDSVNSPQLDITNYYKALCRIIEKAEKLDIKLTGLKLIDAW